MPTPSLTPTYILAVVAAVVGLFVTQGLIDNQVGQFVSGLAAVLIPLALALIHSNAKGHQVQAASRVQAAQIHANAVQTAHAPRARVATKR